LQQRPASLAANRMLAAGQVGQRVILLVWLAAVSAFVHFKNETG